MGKYNFQKIGEENIVQYLLQYFAGAVDPPYLLRGLQGNSCIISVYSRDKMYLQGFLKKLILEGLGKY